MQRIGIAVAMAFLVAGPARGQEAVVDGGGEGRPRFLVASADVRGRVEVAPNNVPVLRRRLSLAVDKLPIASVLEQVARQAGVIFSYDPARPALDRRLTMHVEKLTLAAILTEVLFETGLDVLVADQRHLALVPRTHGPSRVGPSGVIVGTVSDSSTKSGIVGVEVYLASTQARATTDSGGHYRLESADTGTYTLVARRLGYAKLSRRVRVREGQEDTVNLVMRPMASQLQDLVTTASGQQRRRDIGNPVTTIRADSVLRTAPIRSLTDLLDGRVPGLTTQHTSGAPGDPARLRLRGIGSIHGNNDPVVIVDGVRIYAAQSAARSGNLTNLGPKTTAQGDSLRVNRVDVPAPSPLDQIDPNIIDKIEVFRGPSAATLYGADAANGVIVVTTKRGKAGPTRWNASASLGRTSTPGQYPIGYYRWGHQFFTGEEKFCTLLDKRCVQDSLVHFQALNVPDLSVLGAGHRAALSLTASGGTQALTYSVTGSYGNETGLLQLPAFEVERFQETFNRQAPDWMRRSHQLKDWSVTSNIAARLGASADVTLGTTLSRSEQQRTSLEQQIAPMAGTYVDTVNKIYYRPASSNGSFLLDPTTAILRDYYIRQTASSINFTTNLTGNWRPKSWFTATGQAGLNVIPRRDALLLPAGLIDQNDSGAASQGVGRSLVSTFNLQGTARAPLGRGFVFQTSVGANLKTETTNDLISAAKGLVPGTGGISGAKQISAVEQGTNTSVFGWWIEPRITGERFSINTGLRLDGGSAYGVRLSKNGSSGLLGGLLALPQLSSAWVVSEEPWFPFKGLFSSLQLRASYGHAQVQPGPTDRLRLYTETSDTAGARLLLTTLGNTRLRPERSTELTGGFLADLLDSRVSVDLTLYRKIQKDALMAVRLPPSVNNGGSVITNIGDIRNIGTELTFGVTPVRSPLVTWSLQANYSRNNNVLAKIGDGVLPNKTQGIVEGYPVEARWARPILGFVDENADGVLQPQEIRVGDSLVFMGRLLPAYTTSLFANIALFNGNVGMTAGFDYNSGGTQVDQTARTNWVLARALVDSGASIGEQAAVLASTRTQNPTDYGLIQDISTFRFKSFSVNYRAPQSVARLVGAQQLQVAVQGDNLGLHTTYRGKDPDVNAWSASEAIQDTGQLPLPRTWQVSLYVTY